MRGKHSGVLMYWRACLCPTECHTPPSRLGNGLDPCAVLSARRERMSSEERHLRLHSPSMPASLSRSFGPASKEGDRTIPLDVGVEAGCMRGVRGLPQSSSSVIVSSVQYTA